MEAFRVRYRQMAKALLQKHAPFIEKKTGKVVSEYMTRKEDSLSHKNKNTDIVSGAIYFKQELVFVDSKPRIILKGDIIPNPDARNKLTEDEIKKLKEIIFSLK